MNAKASVDAMLELCRQQVRHNRDPNSKAHRRATDFLNKFDGRSFRTEQDMEEALGEWIISSTGQRDFFGDVR